MQCPLINYHANKVSILQKWNRSEPQTRVFHKRRPNKLNLKKNLYNIQLKALEFKETLTNDNNSSRFFENSVDYDEEINEEPNFTLENIGEKTPNSEGIDDKMKVSWKENEKNRKINQNQNYSKKQTNEIPIFPEKSHNLLQETSPLFEIKPSEIVKNQENKGNNDVNSMKFENIVPEKISDLMNFDLFQNYKFYYPHNNLSHLIKHLQVNRIKKKARKSYSKGQILSSLLFQKNSRNNGALMHEKQETSELFVREN